MVGLEMKSGTQGTQATSAKKEVARRIKADPRVSKVMVTTVPNLVTRIKDIASGVLKGKPVSSFSTQMKELARRIAPTM
jgi:YhcN/YlaJ family sporulation lipoprotein